MSNEIEKTRPTKIQRKDYLEKDKERFRDPSKAGAPKAMSVHDPYEPQWDPNPSGKATTTVIIEHSPVKPRDCRTIPAGSIVLDQNRHPVFETMETAVLDGASEAVVGAIACEAGAHGNIDVLSLVAIQGIPISIVRASNPYPGIGGADIRDGVEVMGTGPEMPRLAELAKNAEPSDLGEKEALFFLGGTNTNDLPAPWPYVIHDALRRRSMRDITTLAMVINGPKATMALRHCDEFHQTHEIVLGFESRRLVEVGVGTVDVAALEEGKC